MVDTFELRAPYLSVDLITAELIKRGWQLQPIRFFDGRKFFELVSPQGKVWLTPHNLVAYPFTPSLARLIAMNKNMAYDLAAEHGVTVPVTLKASTYSQEAEAMLAHAPLVVKPLDSHGSRGVTLNIMTAEALRSAFEHACQFSPTALVQKQVQGEEMRLTVLDGKVVSVIMRQTARVVGDGQASVGTLIERENQIRSKDLAFEYLAYPQVSASSVADVERVPADSEVVALHTATLVSQGASLLELSDETHDSYKQKAIDLARLVGAGFLAVDFLLQDYTKPAAEDNYAFLEMNTSPALKMYYATRNQKQYDIVAELATLIEQQTK